MGVDAYFFSTELAFMSLNDLIQILLDGFFEAARNLVGVLGLLAFDAGHCRCVARMS